MDESNINMTDLLLAIFTGLLVLVTGFLALIAYRQQKAIHVAQRAYVKMSHAPSKVSHEPSFRIEPTTGKATVDLVIKNNGQTPARIIDLFIKIDVEPVGASLPKNPNYEGGVETKATPQAFLVTNDQYTLHLFFHIPTAQAANVINGTETLWLYGYVDYEDMFEQKHRGGYARVYEPTVTGGNNLVYIEEPGYNYDRPL